MPRTKLRLGRRGGHDSDSDEGELNFKSGPLSHISERSEEYAGSAVGSVYHSVDGSAVGSEVRAESSQELRNSEFHELSILQRMLKSSAIPCRI